MTDAVVWLDIGDDDLCFVYIHPILGRINRQVSALESFQARHFHNVCGHMPARDHMVEKDLL